jgi:hypothetical protein
VRDLLVILRAAAPFSVADTASTACRRHPIEGPDTQACSQAASLTDFLWLDDVIFGGNSLG